MRALWQVVVLGLVACGPTSSTVDDTVVFLDAGGGGAATSDARASGGQSAAGGSGGQSGAGGSGGVRPADANFGGTGSDAGRPLDAGTGGTGAGGGSAPADLGLAGGHPADAGPSGGSSEGGSNGGGGAGGRAVVDDRCPGRAPDPGEVPAATRFIADLTGTQTSSGAFGVGGTDLGIPVRQPNGQIAYIFGDTFDQDLAGGPGWRSPVLLRSAPGLDGNGIVFNDAAGGAYARQILDYDHGDPNFSTWLPSDVITIGDRMYLHFIVNAGLGNVRWTQIAYSDDNGEHWALSDARWAADEDDFLRQLWTWERGCDGYVYVMSTSFIDRSRPIILYRVPEDRLLDRNAYEPWGFRDGQWAWGNPASVVLEGRFGELSLRRVEDKWVLSWFNAGDYDITVKVFDGPTSNLYEARTFKPITGAVFPQLYGGYIHPDSTLANLHLIVSQWNTANGWPYHATQWVTSVR